jgi:hypothetical protein
MNEHYMAVLADLRGRRAKLEAELHDVDAAIGGLQRLLGETLTPSAVPLASSPQSSPNADVTQQPHVQAPQPHSRFTNISVRWGTLWYLAEDAHDFVKTGEIANALLAGGYKTKAVNFPNMVSAVLSAMKDKGEVETKEDGGGYRLTEQGRRTWNAIRQGARPRFGTSSSEHSLLSVQ